MKDKAYLILNRRGVVGLRKSRPSLRHGELAVRLSVEVPNTVFDKYPEASLSINEADLIHPDLTVEVTGSDDVQPMESESNA